MKKLLWGLMMGLFASLALADDHRHGNHGQEAHPVRVHQPFVRLMPPAQPNTGAFMVLENTSTADRAVVRAESAVSRVVELHTHSMVNGVMQMREIPEIRIPAGQRTELKPGGLHVMLIGLHQPLQEGQQVAITLVFDDDSRQTVMAPVRHPGREMPMHGHHHGMGQGQGQAARDVSELSSPLMVLTPVIGKHADALGLTPAQRQILRQWVASAPARRAAVEDEAMQWRAKLRAAILANEPAAERQQMAQRIGELEAELLMIRSACVEHWRKHLSAEQFAQALSLAGLQ